MIDYWRIYRITNNVNGKVYIGQTSRPLRVRWQEHLDPSSGCRKLARALFKHGHHSFEIQEIDSATSQTQADEKEKYYIVEYLSTILGYNITDGGAGATRRFCPAGHDKDLAGRTSVGACKVCNLAYSWKSLFPDKSRATRNRYAKRNRESINQKRRARDELTRVTDPQKTKRARRVEYLRKKLKVAFQDFGPQLFCDLRARDRRRTQIS